MVNLRIKFSPGEQAKFIQDVYEKSGFSTLQLAQMIGIHRRSFIDWRRERLTIPLNAAEVFCKEFNLKLPEDKRVMIERWKEMKRQASKRGGVSTFKKYGSPATVEGRKKGGARALANLRKRGKIPPIKTYNLPKKHNVNLAEYIGIMLGDGGITPYQCTITLNREQDKDYVIFVSAFGEELFGESPKFVLDKDSKAITIYYNGSSLVKYFVEIGLKIGNKVRQQVDVPDWIKKSKKYRIACLRGLMDTDGGVFLHRYKVKGKEYSYKKISFSNRSVPLLAFVSETLSILGFTPKIIDKIENKKVWLYNEQEVELYLKIVGTNNKRLLKHNI